MNILQCRFSRAAGL